MLRRRLVKELSHRQPRFKIQPKNVKILSRPVEFHASLLEMIRKARRRIFLSSLYVGGTGGGADLVDELGSALTRNPGLTVHMILDYNRSTRPDENSVQLLLPLVKEFPKQIRLSLFRSPSLFARMVPPRYREGWGTWHCKIYGADDDVLISGANLNQSYFTNRQDRYIHLASTPGLAQYCVDFMNTASNVSYRVLPCSSLKREEAHRIPGFQHLQSVNRRPVVEEEGEESEECTLFPIIQAGQFGMVEEEECVGLLVDSLSTTTPTIHFTSGYFGLNERYRKLVLDSKFAKWRMMAAGPQANGFYGSKGISGRIPEGYTYLEQQFMKAAAHSDIQLDEWERSGWTYHAKGIWLSSQPDTPTDVTVFGSTNFNSRSSFIDTELSFIMVLPDEAMGLRRDFDDELKKLKEHAVGWRGAEREVRLGTKMIVKVVGGML